MQQQKTAVQQVGAADEKLTSLLLKSAVASNAKILCSFSSSQLLSNLKTQLAGDLATWDRTPLDTWGIVLSHSHFGSMYNLR